MRVAAVGTTDSLVFRLSDDRGDPLSGTEVRPEVVVEPEGVRTHMQFFPPAGQTNSIGEFRTDVLVGDKPGRYETVFFYNNPKLKRPAFAKVSYIVQESNWTTMLILSLAGGLAIFLYGMRLASEGLQSVVGSRLRSAFAELTRNQFLGLVLGVLLTFFTQSSGATTVMLMSFVRAKLLSFRNSLGILLGAAIGGTITVQLISFNLFAYALPAVAVGFTVYFLGNRPRLQALGLAAMGFGLVFFGMKVMTDQMSPLKVFPFFRETIEALGAHPVWSVILSAAFTAASQSSGATLGIVLSLARQDLINLHDAIPIFFGASIGVCFTGLTGSLGAPVEAKRIAWAHLLYKIAGVLLFLPLIPLLEKAGWEVTRLLAHGSFLPNGEAAVRAIANTYTLFISVTAFLMLPLIPFLERLTKRLVPNLPEYANGETRIKYLDPQLLETPSVALGSTLREISRMGRFVEEMMKQIAAALFEKEQGATEFIRQRDNKVDRLCTEITHYLTNLTKRSLSEGESLRAMSLLYIVSDLESIGDILDKNLVPLAQKMDVHNYEFSERGKEDLQSLHHRVSERLAQMLIALATDNAALAEPLVAGFEALQNEGKRLHLRHLQRLQDGLPESIETSSVHLDVINYLLRIDFLIFDISLHLTGKVRQMSSFEVS